MDRDTLRELIIILGITIGAVTILFVLIAIPIVLLSTGPEYVPCVTECGNALNPNYNECVGVCKTLFD